MKRRESHVCATYPPDRWVVATTTDPELVAAMLKAVLAMRTATQSGDQPA